jgi:NADPH-dependent 2,4-dienoyl-CoA reductase/sulfur reductase-like enzyme
MLIFKRLWYWIRKRIKVNRFLETNIKDIYAIGDCAEQHEAIDLRRPIEAVWYTGWWVKYYRKL